MTAVSCNTTPAVPSPITGQVHWAERCVGTWLFGQCWLLPALSMRQWVLLLPCDEGGAPHWAAVAVPEPAHRGWWGVGGAAKAMVRLSLCSERRGRAPHHHGQRKSVSECLFFPQKMARDPLLFSATHTEIPCLWEMRLFGPHQQHLSCVPLCCKLPVDNVLLQNRTLSVLKWKQQNTATENQR